MSNEELEAKVAELEKRVKFLYQFLEKQMQINQQCINNIGDVQELIIGCSNACQNNSTSIALLSKLIENEP